MFPLTYPEITSNPSSVPTPEITRLDTFSTNQVPVFLPSRTNRCLRCVRPLNEFDGQWSISYRATHLDPRFAGRADGERIPKPFQWNPVAPIHWVCQMIPPEYPLMARRNHGCNSTGYIWFRNRVPQQLIDSAPGGWRSKLRLVEICPYKNLMAIAILTGSGGRPTYIQQVFGSSHLPILLETSLP